MALGIDWDSLAAQVTANFLSTGQWFAEEAGTPSPPAGPVDWDALALEVTRNFARTGQWFLDGEETPSGPQPPGATITGTGGPDELRETLRRDVFLGGVGTDSFGFGILEFRGAAPNEFQGTVLGTGPGPGLRDVILDFQQGEDVIDLSEALQWRRRFSFEDAEFSFIGTEEFSGTDHELRYEVVGDRTILQIDGSVHPNLGATPDGVTDAEIELVGVYALTEADFIL